MTYIKTKYTEIDLTEWELDEEDKDNYYFLRKPKKGKVYCGGIIVQKKNIIEIR